MTDLVGKQLGNYRLMSLLGRGGFAEVYQGEHIYLKSQAAIKVLRIVPRDEEVKSFLREAQKLVSLRHPHIVRVLDFDLRDVDEVGRPQGIAQLVYAKLISRRSRRSKSSPRILC